LGIRRGRRSGSLGKKWVFGASILEASVGSSQKVKRIVVQEGGGGIKGNHWAIVKLVTRFFRGGRSGEAKLAEGVAKRSKQKEMSGTITMRGNTVVQKGNLRGKGQPN